MEYSHIMPLNHAPFNDKIKTCTHMVGKPLYIVNFMGSSLELHHETSHHALSKRSTRTVRVGSTFQLLQSDTSNVLQIGSLKYLSRSSTSLRHVIPKVRMSTLRTKVSIPTPRMMVRWYDLRGLAP